MNCFHLPIEAKAEIARSESSLHHMSTRNGEKMTSGELIKNCLSQISPDKPEKGIVAAKVMECALREIVNQERVKRSLAEFYGVNYLLTSLTQAIRSYEREGRLDELMFVSMRIGRELSNYQGSDFTINVDRLI